MLSKVHLVETDRFVEIGNFQPACVKTDNVWMAVLTYNADLFDRFVQYNLHLVLPKAALDKQLLHCVLFSLEYVLNRVNNAKSTFTNFLLVLKKLVKLSILTKRCTHRNVDLAFFFKLGKLMSLNQLLLDDGILL